MNTQVETLEAPVVTVTNPIAITSYTVEHLTKDQTEARIIELLENGGKDDFELGGLFCTAKENGWFEDYADFFEYASQKFGVESRKARYLMANYATLTKENISWDKVKCLGWTKLMILAPVINAENIDAWVVKAKSVNTDTLKVLVKHKTLTEEEASSAEATVHEVAKIAFTVHTPQKETIKTAITKAKEKFHVTNDAMALEKICSSYLKTDFTVPQKQKHLATQMKERGWQVTLAQFVKVFPDIHLEITVPSEAQETQAA